MDNYEVNNSFIQEKKTAHWITGIDNIIRSDYFIL